MTHSESLAIRKGMECLAKNLTAVEAEMFISALMQGAINYTEWRQKYFEKAYRSEDGSQLQAFLASAAQNDPHGASFGIE